MKTLLWKEFRQHWVLVVAGIAAGLILVGARMLWTTNLSYEGMDEELAFAVLVAYALVTGSVMVASETRSGTIVELFSRPIDPWKVWLGKAAFGLAATYLPVGIYLAGVLATPSKGILFDVGLLALSPVFGFAVAMFASTLASKPLHALAGAVLCIAGGYVTCLAALHEILFGSLDILPVDLIDVPMLYIGLGSGALLFLAFSFVVFVKGQIHTGQPRRKWQLAAGLLSGTVAVGLIALLVGANVYLRMEPTRLYRIENISVSPNGTNAAVVVHSSGAMARWIVNLQSGTRIFPSIYLNVKLPLCLVEGAWSPDSRRFATWYYAHKPLFPFSMESWGEQLAVLDVEAATVHVASDATQGSRGPLRWSPAGDVLYHGASLLVWNASEPTPTGWVEHISPTGNIIRKLELDHVLIDSVVGDDSIVFVCYSPPHENGAAFLIYLVSAKSGEKTAPALSLPEDDWTGMLCVSPNRRYVVYQKNSDTVGATSGGPEDVLSVNKRSTRRAVSQRDGKDTVGDVKMKDLLIGTDTRILEVKGGIHYLATGFSPDSRRVALTKLTRRLPRDLLELFWRQPLMMLLLKGDSVSIVDLESGHTDVLVEPTMQAHSSHWSHDGASLAVLFRSTPGAVGLIDEGSVWESKLVVADFSKSEMATETITTGMIAACDWLSNDELLYAEGNALYRIKVDGTGRKKVFPR